MNISKRSLLGVALAGIFVFVASAASADVYVWAKIDKTKTKNVTENIYITKHIYLTVSKSIDVDAVAEQEIIKNQVNRGNEVFDEGANSTADILDASFVSVNGVVLINQSPGFQNNQGNEVSITYAESPTNNTSITTPCASPPDCGGVLSHAQVAIEQRNRRNGYLDLGDELVNSSYLNTIGAERDPTDPDPPDGPFANGSGIVDINQAAGHMNNQNNAQAIALGDTTVYALGEIDLGQWNTLNQVDVAFQTRSDVIAGGAFAGFDGIVKINQSSGSMNNQANIIDIAADISVRANPLTVTPAPGVTQPETPL